MQRVPHVTDDDISPENRENLYSALQDGKPVNVYAAIGNNEDALVGLRGFLGALWSGSGLSDRQREIVILAVSSEIGSEYEWHQHVNVARSKDLLDDSELDAISAGHIAAFAPEERTLIDYAVATVRGQVSDDHHAAMAEHFDDHTIVGTATLAAGYLGLGRVIDALAVELEEEFVGWSVT